MSETAKPAFGKKVAKKSSGAGGLIFLGVLGLLACGAAIMVSMSSMAAH